MSFTTFISRILLGGLFASLGLNGLTGFLPAAVPLAHAADASRVISEHFAFVAYASEALAGALLLIGRYTPLAVALLAPAFASSSSAPECLGP